LSLTVLSEKEKQRLLMKLFRVFHTMFYEITFENESYEQNSV